MKKGILFLLCFLPLLFGQNAGAVDNSKNFELVRQIEYGNYAIVVGVSDYLHNEIEDLHYCEKDATDFYNVLVTDCGYKKEHVIKLIGKDATREKIINMLTGLANQKLYPHAETIIFYFSGHGMASNNENFILPFDGSVKESKMQESNIAIDSVKNLLENSTFTKRLIFIDACRYNPEGKAYLGSAKGFIDVSTAYAHAKGTKILLGCEFGKLSYENDQAQNGLFTSYLLDGLRGSAASSDNRITIGLLEEYVFDKMASYTRNNKEKEQIPVSMGEGSSTIPIAVANGGTHPGGTDSKGSYSSLEEQLKELIKKVENDNWIIDICNSELSRDPNNYVALTFRGRAYNGNKKYDKSIPDLNRAIGIKPNYAPAYYGRGNYYMNGRKDYDRAIADYNRAIELDPNNADAYDDRGAAYADGRKDYDRAIVDYDKAIELDPNNASAYTNRGNAYFMKGDYYSAFDDYDKAIELDPNNASAYTNRGNAYFMKGDYFSAIHDYNKALAIDPHFELARNNKKKAEDKLVERYENK